MRRLLAKLLALLARWLDGKAADKPAEAASSLVVLDTFCKPPQWRLARPVGISGLRLLVEIVGTSTRLCIDAGSLQNPADFPAIWRKYGGAALEFFDEDGNKIEVM